MSPLKKKPKGNLDKTHTSGLLSAILGKLTRKNEKSKSKDVQVFSEEKRTKKHKRQVDSPPEEDCENVKNARHKCSVNAMFRVHRRNRVGLLKALREGSQNYDYVPDAEIRILSNELDACNGDSADNIIESMKRNSTLKLHLPPISTARSELADFSCSFEGHEWKKDVNNPTIKAVDRNIRQVVDSVLLPRDRYEEDLNGVLNDLNEAVKFKEFTNCWTRIGSYVNGLVCLDSDINLHLECVPENDSCYSVGVENILKKVAVFITADKEKFLNPKLNSCVRFPWVKTWSTRFEKEVEITFSTDWNSGGILKAKSLLMKLYVDMSPNLKYLTVFVRIILQRYRIYGTAAKFQSNTIFWLVVFFMQQKKLLPAVFDLRNAAEDKNYIEGWDCSLPESYSHPTESVSLYWLLLEFFEYYKNFDFLNYVICPYVGRFFRFSNFEQFSQYMPQVNNPRQLTFFRNVINLQDPCDLCQNVAEFIEPENANKFNIVCHRLSEQFSNSVEKIETMDCFCNNFTNTEDFYEYSPYNLIQYAVLGLRTIQYLHFDQSREKKLNQMHIEEAIRRIMEMGFKFRKNSIVSSRNITKTVDFDKGSNEASIVEEAVPVVYFEYCSSNNTWRNEYIKEIIPRKEYEKEEIRIFLLCEVCLEKHFVRILAEGQVHFVKFLRRHLLKLLKCTLEGIVP